MRQLKVKLNKKTSEYYEKITTETQIIKYVPHDKENSFPTFPLLQTSTPSLNCSFSDNTEDSFLFQDKSLNEFTFNPFGKNISAPQNSKTANDVTFDPIGEENSSNQILRVSNNSNEFFRFPFHPTQHGIISSDDILSVHQISKKTNQFTYDPTEEDPYSEDFLAINSKKTNQITFDPSEHDISSVPENSKRKNQLLFHPTGEDLSSDDTLPIPEYSKEIYKYLRGREISLMPLQDYMELQPDITFSMRATLVDWLVEVAEEYKLNTQTIYLAVSYIDRFLSEMSVERSKLQLVGTASMLIAAKFQEIYPPPLKEFVFITDNSYSKQEVLQMEKLVLQVLDFVVSAPTSHEFLSHYSRMFEVEDKTLHLALYLNELSLLDGGTFLSFPPSLLAASSLVLSRHTLGLEAWSDEAAEEVGYGLKDMRECIVGLNRIFGEAPNLEQQAVREKYKHSEFSSVAKVCPVDIM